MEPTGRSEAVRSPDIPTSTSVGVSGWERACRILGLIGVVVFLACAYTPLPNLLAHSLAARSRLEPAEAIVVLAASVSEDGALGDVSLRRAIQGIVLQRKGLAPLLVLSGPAPDTGPTEAEVRAALALDLGVPAEAINMESRGRTTREEAIRIGEFLRARQVRRILLVTDSQHMARATPLRACRPRGAPCHRRFDLYHRTLA
ncbi:MAG TPA: YdcF family protein [Candidatus Methylomirabilis sp.]|nr:YdcF family protein [Candidatus Methylomirabilis sp.]